MKRPSLFGKPQTAQAQPEPVQTSAPPKIAGSSGGRKFPLASTREGKRMATVYMDPEAWKQLQMIALEEETTIQALLSEGVNHVFERRGRTRLA